MEHMQQEVGGASTVHEGFPALFSLQNLQSVSQTAAGDEDTVKATNQWRRAARATGRSELSGIERVDGSSLRVFTK